MLQNLENEQWVSEENYITEADFSRLIQALYATWSGKLLGIDYQLGYKKIFGKSSSTIESYHRNTTNGIIRIQQATEGNLMIHTMENIQQEQSTGVELSLNTSIYKWWNINLTGNYYRYAISGDVVEEGVQQKGNQWNARYNSTFKLPTGTRIQLSGMFRGPSLTPQGEREGFFMANAAVRQTLIKDKLSLTVNGMDLFQGRRREMTINGNTFENYILRRRESPVFSFSINYIINNYKNGRQKDKDKGDEYEGIEMF